jgi:hypothetical protein
MKKIILLCPLCTPMLATYLCIKHKVWPPHYHNILQAPSKQCIRASKSIQDLLPCWILTIFKLKFGGGNLFSPAMTSTIGGNNSVGLLLEPLLKKVTPVVGSRML